MSPSEQKLYVSPEFPLTHPALHPLEQADLQPKLQSPTGS